MSEEKVYTFNEYVLGYDSGENNDRSCLTISKILNDNMYVMSTLYDGSAEVISTMLDSLQQKVEQLEKENISLKEANNYHQEVIKSMREPENAHRYHLENIKLRAINNQLEKQVEQLESIRKEAIEYILTCNDEKILNSMFLDESYISNYGAKDLLNILNKGDE